MRHDCCHVTAYQIGCEVRQLIKLILRPPILDGHILTLDMAGFAEALPECGHETRSIARPRAAKESDYRHCRLLRGCHQRPRCRAANKCDELAAFHSHHPQAGSQVY